MIKPLAKIQPINFHARREKAFELLDESSLIVFSAQEPSSITAPYRQNSLLYYLTGFMEPESVLVLTNTQKSGKVATLFLRDHDPIAELWDGKRLGVEKAAAALEIDQAFDIRKLSQELPRLLVGCQAVYHEFGVHEKNDLCVLRALDEEKKLRGRHSFSHRLDLKDARSLAGQLRLVKEPEELERMRQACHITAQGFAQVQKNLALADNERQIHGWLLGSYLSHGAEMEAYQAIVAAGANACCLHYRANNAPIKSNDLILIDSGCQFDYYASDVTRCFPRSGKFSVEQRLIYEAVLEVQKSAINIATSGISMQDIHEKTVLWICEKLRDIGLLRESMDEIHEQGLYRKYFPHGTGHWLGMDVHDVGDYSDDKGKPIALAPRMCFTIEPGIYVPEDDPSPAAEKFRGIGVRIEDDICITASGHEVLSRLIPKEPSELEFH